MLVISISFNLCGAASDVGIQDIMREQPYLLPWFVEKLAKQICFPLRQLTVCPPGLPCVYIAATAVVASETSVYRRFPPPSPSRWAQRLKVPRSLSESRWCLFPFVSEPSPPMSLVMALPRNGAAGTFLIYMKLFQIPIKPILRAFYAAGSALSDQFGIVRSTFLFNPVS